MKAYLSGRGRNGLGGDPHGKGDADDGQGLGEMHSWCLGVIFKENFGTVEDGD